MAVLTFCSLDIAAAYTAGLAAYFIRLVQTGQLNHPNGGPVQNSPQGIKDFIVNQANGDPAGSAWSRMQVENQDQPGIFNAIDINQRQCPYNPNEDKLPARADSTASCITGPGSTLLVLPTSAKPAPPHAPTQTLQIKPVVCHDASNFKGHGDIAGSAVSYDGGYTCENWFLKDIGPNQSLSRTIKTSGVNYEFDVEWIAGCFTTVSTQSVWSPLGPNAEAKDQCTDIFYNCWKNCKLPGTGKACATKCPLTPFPRLQHRCRRLHRRWLFALYFHWWKRR